MKQLDYIQAKQLIDEFCRLAEKQESMFYSYGFLQGFAAQCLSGRAVEHSLNVIEAAIKDMKHSTVPAPSF